MKAIIIASQAELLKLKRSGIVAVTIALFIFIPIMMGLLMYIAQHPEIGKKLGLMAAKAQIFSENSWKGYFEINKQVIAVLGVIGFGFITSWMFGREYIEGTLTDILALPSPRWTIVIAKHLIIILWCAVLLIVFTGTSFLVGGVSDIPGADNQLFVQYIKELFISWVLIVLLNPVIGLIASISNGVIAPIGFVILTVIMAQFAALLGFGAYFPWAIPGIYATMGSDTGIYLISSSYYIIVLISLLTLFCSMLWWIKADHH